MNLLEKYGWNQFFSNHYLTREEQEFLPGRITSVKGHTYHLITEKGELRAELSGKLLVDPDKEKLPRVGDWVFYLDYDTQGYIVGVFPRQNALTRKNPGTTSERQVLAANIDYALIVQGLDRDFNIMRLDRYIVQITGCGIKPVIILNKEDLIADRQVFETEIARLERQYPVYFCSTLDATVLNSIFKQILKPLNTHVLIGSSGVGKSSIINALIEQIHLRTGGVSDSTGKGKHTTSTRDLFMLPDGCMIIDTPGMREFGIALEDEITSSGLFPVIDSFADGCRYADCSHRNEAGCAVVEAVRNGNIDPAVYASYIKLLKEQEHFEIRAEDRKRLGKQFVKMVREVKEYRKKYKY